MFTKGPWTYKDRTNGMTHQAEHPTKINITTVNGYRSVACAYVIHGDLVIAEENARLISAAPELLEALEEMVQIAEIATGANIFGYPAHADGSLPKAIAAIKKARGS